MREENAQGLCVGISSSNTRVTVLRRPITDFPAWRMHFVYTFVLIIEHFWVTAAKADSLPHLFLQ